jgi:hypothetical protein
MPTVSAVPEAQVTQPAETTVPVINITDSDPVEDINMATKLDDQKSKAAERKTTREAQAKVLNDNMDRLLAKTPAALIRDKTPGASVRDKKSKATPTKAATRAAAVPTDDKGVPLVTAAVQPLG